MSDNNDDEKNMFGEADAVDPDVELHAYANAVMNQMDDEIAKLNLEISLIDHDNKDLTERVKETEAQIELTQAELKGGP